MSKKHAEDLLEELTHLDPNMKVSELTVGQLLESINFKESADRARRLIEEYQERVNEMKALQAQSRDIFKNAETLTQVTTPFECRSLSDVDKIAETLRAGIGQNRVVIVAIAIKDP